MLTTREGEVVEMVLNGHTNREIGNLFSVSEKTVKFHLTSIYKKLAVKNRNQLMAKLMVRR